MNYLKWKKIELPGEPMIIIRQPEADINEINELLSNDSNKVYFGKLKIPRKEKRGGYWHLEKVSLINKNMSVKLTYIARSDSGALCFLFGTAAITFLLLFLLLLRH